MSKNIISNLVKIDIIKKLSKTILFENSYYILFEVNDYYTNFNIVNIIDCDNRWCTLKDVSFKNLTNDGNLYRLYDKKRDSLYSIYVLNNGKIKHIIDTKHKHREYLKKIWDIPFLNKLDFI